MRSNWIAPASPCPNASFSTCGTARVRSSVSIGYAALVILAQLVLSPVWLTHYRFGPAEWLLRSLM